jgi:hypothetical protein
MRKETTTITNEKKEALVRKIRALTEKTVQNGCTEGEAAAAAETATRLMEQYGVTLSEIEAEPDKEDFCEQGYVQTGKTFHSKVHHVVFCAGAIADFTNTKRWRQGSRIMYFGFAADVETAKYLTEVFRAAMDCDWRAHCKALKEEFPSRGSARRSFMIGMAHRLSKRLYIRKRELESAQAERSESRALAVVKSAIVDKAYETLNLELRSAPQIKVYLDTYRHFLAGQAAADNVHIPTGGLDNKAKRPGPLR